MRNAGLGYPTRICCSLLAACLGNPSGRIVEKPLINEKPDGGLSRHSFSDGGDVRPSQPEQAGKACCGGLGDDVSLYILHINTRAIASENVLAIIGFCCRQSGRSIFIATIKNRISVQCRSESQIVSAGNFTTGQSE